jgi:carbamoyl-phosphate synthase large subunit
MPKRTDIKKVLLIGSGPIQIGQAAEFDFSGSQACRSLREEGIEVVLVNSNPATIMTDPEMAERIYIEPLRAEIIAKIIEKEKPDGILSGMGGQTGLNLTAELAEMGALNGVEILGTPLEAIYKGEDREKFRDLMNEIGEPVPKSIVINTLSQIDEAIEKIGLPAVVRPAYTLGGAGGGIGRTKEELTRIVELGLSRSRIHQVLIEQSVMGWKELEFEVMRDATDTCIIVCSMENVDPMGIHTGESVVVAPILTLRDDEFQMMRSAAIHIIRALTCRAAATSSSRSRTATTASSRSTPVFRVRRRLHRKQPGTRLHGSRQRSLSASTSTRSKTRSPAVPRRPSNRPSTTWS